ncbi:MAG: hypothetical protein AAF125_13915, partial [Chloroflexota bacterium]
MPKPTYEIPRFLGDPPVPVELISEMTDFTVDDTGVSFTCRTDRHTPIVHNYYGSETETVWDAPTAGRPVAVRLDWCTPEVFRLRAHPGDAVPANDMPMVVGTFDDPVPFEVTEDEAILTLTTQAIHVHIVREPWQIIVTDHDENLIWATKPVDIEGLRRPEEQWNPPQQRWIFLHRYAYPAGTADHGDRRYSFLSFDLHYDEHIYGLGESYGRLDKRETY